MIQSFTDEATEAVFHGIHTHEIRRKLPSDLVKAAERKLDILNCAESLESLHLIPSIGANAVRDAHGKYSIPIDTEWRLTFRWNNGPADLQLKNW